MNVDLEELLIWDIETVPKEGFNKDNPLWDTWKHRNRKEKMTDEELLDKFSKEGGLFAEYLTIVCISCAFIHNGEIRISSFTGDEKNIIDGFLKVAEYIFNKKNTVVSVGHNVVDFDIPVTRKCYSRYYPMFTYPDYISDLNTKGKLPTSEKPWVMADRCIDTLKLQKGSNYMFSSMAEVAISLGLPTPKLDTDGSMVAEIFRQGDIKRITNYCENDVLTSLAIVFNWLGLEMLPIAKRNEEIVVEDSPLLKKIYSSAKITEENKEEINELVKSKDLTKEDKENLVSILCAVYQQKGEKVGVKKAKKAEVEKFIKTL